MQASSVGDPFKQDLDRILASRICWVYIQIGPVGSPIHTGSVGGLFKQDSLGYIQAWPVGESIQVGPVGGYSTRICWGLWSRTCRISIQEWPVEDLFKQDLLGVYSGRNYWESIQSGCVGCLFRKEAWSKNIQSTVSIKDTGGWDVN